MIILRWDDEKHKGVQVSLLKTLLSLLHDSQVSGSSAGRTLRDGNSFVDSRHDEACATEYVVRCISESIVRVLGRVSLDMARCGAFCFFFLVRFLII